MQIFTFLLYSLSLFPTISSTYDLNTAYINVWLSGSAYCGKDQYLSMKLQGPASGFVVTNVLHDIKTDLEGFIGYLPSAKTINIVFRGSDSLLNWIDDIEVRQVQYTTWPECDCNVHNGFYKATLNLKNDTIKYVRILLQKYPKWKIQLTGHSLGSAIVDLMSMELMKELIGMNLSVYGFGKPRVGDKAYSEFYNTKIIEHYRHTHNKDIVPHIPPYISQEFGYYHSCQEIFEDEIGTLTHCSTINCEDPLCGNQYSIRQTNTDDHSYYLGHYLDCTSSTEHKFCDRISQNYVCFAYK